MPALAELSPVVSRNGHLVGIYRGYFDFRAMEKKVEFPARNFSSARFHKDCRFESIRCGQ